MPDKPPPMPIKTAELDHTEAGYPGFKSKRWLNVPLGVHRQLREADTEEESRECFLAIFPEWNFVDHEGEAIPHTVEGFDLLPDDLWTDMLTRGLKAVKEAALPANLGDSSSKKGSDAEPSDEPSTPES